MTRKRVYTGSDSSNAPQAKSIRAPLACERCRVKKLRCTGGNPCRSCHTSGSSCSFDLGLERSLGIGGVDLGVRVTRLEEELVNLRAQFGAWTDGQRVLSTERTAFQTAAENAQQFTGANHSSAQPGEPSAMSASEHSGPSNPLIGENPSNRLANAPTQPIQSSVAPLPPQMHNSSTQNHSTRGLSPQTAARPQPQIGISSFDPSARTRDDPISLGIIDHALGRSLFNLYV